MERHAPKVDTFLNVLMWATGGMGVLTVLVSLYFFFAG
jgi:hypothetical protein